jgi:hypothetical protein
MSKWRQLAIDSHYQTALAIKNELEENQIESAKAGIEELIEALSRSDKRALKSQMIRLMMHIIKWKTQPDKRTPSWVYSIESARMEIADLLADEPSLKPMLESLPTDLFKKAKKLAEAEMNLKSDVVALTQEELFDREYTIESNY